MATKRKKPKTVTRRAGKTTKKKKIAAKATPNPRRSAGGTGLLDAAATVLRKAVEPMSCPEIVEAILKAGTWSTSGKTPAATLSASIHREIRDKGKEARFVKADRGKFSVKKEA